MRAEETYAANYRESVLTPLIENIKSGNCVTLVGLQGVGIEPLFNFILYNKAIEGYLKEEGIYFFLVNPEEYLTIDQRNLLGDFIRGIRKALETYGKKDLPVVSDTSPDEQETLHSVKDLLEHVVKENIKIVVLFQNFDELAKTQLPILTTLFNLYYNCRPHLLYVFGLRTIPERLRSGFTNSFDNIFHNTLIVQPFTREESLDYYKEKFKEDGIVLADQQLSTFYEWIGGYAAYYRHLAPLIEKEDVEMFDKKLGEYAQRPQLQIITRQILSDLKENEVSYLKQLSISGKPVGDSPKLLKSLGLINEEGEVFSKILALHLRDGLGSNSDLAIDDTNRVFVGSTNITTLLSPIEFRFLNYLYSHKGQVCERDDVIEYAWGSKPEGVADEAVDQLVSRLRTKIQENTGQDDIIKTVRGRGFTLDE